MVGCLQEPFEVWIMLYYDLNDENKEMLCFVCVKRYTSSNDVKKGCIN